MASLRISLTRSLAHSLTHRFTYSLTHRLIRSLTHSLTHSVRLCRLIINALDHRSLSPEFESRRGHIHLAYHVHKSGRKTSINQSINQLITFTYNAVWLWMLNVKFISSRIFTHNPRHTLNEGTVYDDDDYD